MICNSLASTWAQIWARPNSTPVIASRKENASWTSLSENLTYESVWPAGLHAHLAVILSEQFGTNSPQNGFGGLNILSILEVALQWLLEKHVPVFSGGRAFRKIRCWGFGRSLANFERNWARSQSRKPWVISGDVKSTRRILFFIARSNIKVAASIIENAASFQQHLQREIVWILFSFPYFWRNMPNIYGSNIIFIYFYILEFSLVKRRKPACSFLFYRKPSCEYV